MVKNWFILSLILFVLGCSIFKTKDLNNALSVEIKSLEMWFDASPKVNSKSYFHASIEFEIFNELNEVVHIDSIVCQFDLKLFQNKVKIPKDGFDREIKSFEKKLIKDQIKFVPEKSINKSRELDLIILIYYRKSDKEFFQRFVFTGKRFEIVY